jgi:ABC-2 type transport system permease protein
VVVRAYWSFARCAFARGLAYRFNLLLRVVGNLVNVLIQVAIWRALIGHGAIAGVSLRVMVTYSILSTCLGMVLLVNLFGAVDERLRTGNIGMDLVKPLSYPLYLAADSLGTTAFQGLFTMLPTLAITALAFGVQPPASPLDLVTCIVATFLALAISFALGYLIALLAFWLLTTIVFEWAIEAFMTVFAGAFLPLWFFPAWLGAVAAWLPFRYMNFVPVAIYLGRIPTGDLAPTLSLGLAWTLALLGLTGWLWSRAMRRLVVQGG